MARSVIANLSVLALLVGHPLLGGLYFNGGFLINMLFLKDRAPIAYDADTTVNLLY